MKKTMLRNAGVFLGVIAAAAITFAMMAGGPAAASESALAGTWAWVDGEDYLYVFNADGTGTRGLIEANEYVETFTWSTPEAGYLVIDLAAPPPGSVNPERWSYTISGQTLTIDSRQVEDMTFSYIRR